MRTEPAVMNLALIGEGHEPYGQFRLHGGGGNHGGEDRSLDARDDALRDKAHTM